MKLHLTLARLLRLLLIVFLISGCSRSGTPADPPGGAQLQPETAQPNIPPIFPSRTPSPAPTAPPTATSLPPLDSPIIWYLRGSAPADLPRVNERLNRELALRGFGAQVEMRVLPPGAFDRWMMTIDEPDEAFDLVALTANHYVSALENEALLPLNDYRDPSTQQAENLLGLAAPALRSNLTDGVWNAWTAKGRGVYAIPNQGAWAQPVGIAIRADVVRALHLQADLDAAQGYADLTPLFARIQAAIDSGELQSSDAANAKKIRSVFGAVDILRPEAAGYDPLAAPLVVRFDDPKREVVDWFATGDFKALVELRRAWQTAGYGPDETLTPDETAEGYQAGRFVVQVGRLSEGGSGSARYGYDWIEKALSPDFIPSGAIAKSLTGISAKIADQPERVYRIMRLLEWLNSDPKLYNLLAFGIEGDHWNWADRDKGMITLLPGSRYRPDFVDQISGGALAYLVDGHQADAPQTASERNASTPVSVVAGFVFNPRRVAGQAAAVKGLTPEWLDALSNGKIRGIDAYIQRMLKDLDDAGLKDIEVELIEQMQAGMGPG